MKKIYLVTRDPSCNGNNIFNLDHPGNRDNCYYPFYCLKKFLADSGADLKTYDFLKKENPDEFELLFCDIPRDIDAIVKKYPTVRKVLLLWETEAVYPLNWNKKKHQFFSTIFVWNDDWVDQKKYFKFHWPMPILDPCDVTADQKTRFCALISGHKLMSHPLELYSERLKTIRWFEQHHPEDFDLYGIGWDRRFFMPPLSVLNRIGLLTRLCNPEFPSYRGKVTLKRDVLRQYKFSFCYENIRDLPGYMTEKIFDSFFAGCVPVYWGASNIEKYVPEKAFIDRREFTSLEDLYRFMKNMTDDEYQGYLCAMRDYVTGDAIRLFSAECFAQLIGNVLLN